MGGGYKMTLDAFLACLAIEVQRCGSQKAFAHAHNLSEQYLSEVLRGSRQPGQKILDAMGYERVVSYEQKKRISRLRHLRGGLGHDRSE